jgi:NADH-quinone oxidoreductase subunit A
MGSLDSYLPIFFMIVLGAAFAGLSLVASKLLAPQRPTAAKEAPYECGIVPEHEPAKRFPVRFYLVAMIFIVFDIEVIFLFPWAVVAGQLGRFGLAEIVVFAAAVFISFVYLISNGALDWGPIKRVQPIGSEARTAASTVRRVPPAGPRGPAGAPGDDVEPIAPAPAAGSPGGEAA